MEMNIAKLNSSFLVKRTIRVNLAVACLFMFLAAGLTLFDCMLLKQNSDFRQRLTGAGNTNPIQIGSHVPPLTGFDVSGRRLAFSSGRIPKKTMLFVFSTECSICKTTWPVWEGFAKRIDRQSVIPVYANLSSRMTIDYAHKHGLEDEIVFAKLDVNVESAYRLDATPQVLLISSDGRVERVWTGQLGDAQLLTLKQALGIQDLSTLGPSSPNPHSAFESIANPREASRTADSWVFPVAADTISAALSVGTHLSLSAYTLVYFYP